MADQGNQGHVIGNERLKEWIETFRRQLLEVRTLPTPFSACTESPVSRQWSMRLYFQSHGWQAQRVYGAEARAMAWKLPAHSLFLVRLRGVGRDARQYTKTCQ